MILQSYHGIATRELGMQREASAPSEGVIVQWMRPGRQTWPDHGLTLTWSNVPAATVRAIELHYRLHRNDRFEIIGRDGVTPLWMGYEGPPVANATDAAAYEVTVNLTPYPR